MTNFIDMENKINVFERIYEKNDYNRFDSIGSIPIKMGQTGKLRFTYNPVSNL